MSEPVSASTAPIAEARDVRKTYLLGRVRVPVLRGASLAVHEGEWVAVLGASGSGKSTLLHLLGDLDLPDTIGPAATAEGLSLARRRRRLRAGRCPRCNTAIANGATVCAECEFPLGQVYFEGHPVSELSPHKRNRYRNVSIGFVFQFYHLLPELTVLENTLLPGLVNDSPRPLRSWLIAAFASMGVAGGVGALLLAMLDVGSRPWWAWLLAIAGAAAVGGLLGPPLLTEARSLLLRFGPRRAALADRARRLLESFGLGHRLDHRPRELSGGERQRVAIARALVNEPRLLLADEPTGNLDEETGREILELIAEQHRRGLTIVMVTHDPTIAARADRIVRLHNGAVQE
jgi:ABC-type lipoprotein export system ATPase subunit